MLLEKAVIFESNPTNSAEDSTLHEMIGVRAEAVDDVCRLGISISSQCLSPSILPWSSHKLI